MGEFGQRPSAPSFPAYVAHEHQASNLVSGGKKIRKALDQLHYPSFRVNMLALQNIGHIIPMLIIQFGQVESLDLLIHFQFQFGG